MDKQEENPRGTITILALYMLVLIALWAWIYPTLLQRGIT